MVETDDDDDSWTFGYFLVGPAPLQCGGVVATRLGAATTEIRQKE